ncbi:MAG: hypothetical protein HZC28_06680 [Spirochaetes bacterium]|nr:hypothetical protein [Spirochaetota bacterium]
MKKLLSVGYEIPGHSDCYINFRSDSSLLDADVVIFLPDISNYKNDSWNAYYQNKRFLNEHSSFELVEDINHWKRELKSLLDVGKTVFIVFSGYEEVFIHTGRKEYSGTGRNQKVTNLVSEINNYSIFPINVPTIIPKSGNEIKCCGNPYFTTFWSEFKDYLSYESYFDGDIPVPLFITKNGNKPVGGLFKINKGNIIILPSIQYDKKEFTSKNGKKIIWNTKGLAWGNRLVNSLLEIDKSLVANNEFTPPPDWVNSDDFQTGPERTIQRKIIEIEKSIDILINDRSQQYISLSNEQIFKGLLYEKGKALEFSVIASLRVLGYTAENYDDGIDEFDQIITSPEGDRFLGESEGKDNSAINIDKFRQLENNIQQDFTKENVTLHAIGILFGNGYRLLSPEKRETQFTDKCRTNAKRLNVILIQTMDLFSVIKYLKYNNDDIFKKKCREAIINSKGEIVIFPKPEVSLHSAPNTA